MKSEMNDRAPPNSTFRGGTWERRREQAVAVTTQEALDGSRENTMRIANVENSALNWGVDFVNRCTRNDALQLQCSARDEMRHINGGSELDVIIGSDRDQNKGAERRTRIT